MNRNFLLLFLLLFGVKIWGQDLSFSQFYAAPLYLNPALTGGFNGNYRVSALLRDQWAGPLERSVKSFSAGLDLRFDIEKGPFGGDAAGVGIQFVSDQANSIDLSSNTISLSGAFHKSLVKSQKRSMSLGFQLTTGQRNVLYEGLFFQDQFNGTDAFDGVTGEDLPANNFGFNDLAIGWNFVSTTNDAAQIFAGISAQHLLEPEYSFYRRDEDFGTDLSIENRLNRKYVLHAAGLLKTGQNLAVSPRLLLILQGESALGQVGANLILEPGNTDSFKFHLGSWITVTKDFQGGPKPESWGTLVGFATGELLIGLSYDLSLRDIVQYRTGQGTFEITLSYIGNYEEDGGACPTF